MGLFRRVNHNQPTRNPDISNDLFFNLHSFLYNLFMNVEFTQNNFQLNKLEKEIIRNIVQKKKFKGFQNITFTEDFFNKARNSHLHKKTEDGLKFIFKKAIKKMKNNFKIKHLNGIKLNSQQLDHHFYSFYFQDIADREGISLECFYHFRNWQNRNSDNIPKSITKNYVRRLKKNPEFVRELRNYLESELIHCFKVFNSKKIRTMIIKWEKIIEEQGRETGIKTIIKMIHSRGNKIPWTLSEVYHALEDSLKYLDYS